MKKLQNLGKSLSKNEQKEIAGGVGGTCSVTLSCPEEYGGGSITCSGTEGRCYRNVETHSVKCDTDPTVYCL